MWKCPKCKEESEDNFDSCWNCGTGLPSLSNHEDRKPSKNISFDCSLCGQHLEVEAEAAGSAVECPSCKGSITVPSKHRIKDKHTWVEIVNSREKAEKERVEKRKEARQAEEASRMARRLQKAEAEQAQARSKEKVAKYEMKSKRRNTAPIDGFDFFMKAVYWFFGILIAFFILFMVMVEKSQNNESKVSTTSSDNVPDSSRIYIPQERADKYLGPKARAEAQEYLKQNGTPNPSQTDIDFVLKLNERLEYHTERAKSHPEEYSK